MIFFYDRYALEKAPCKTLNFFEGLYFFGKFLMLAQE